MGWWPFSSSLTPSPPNTPVSSNTLRAGDQTTSARVQQNEKESEKAKASNPPVHPSIESDELLSESQTWRTKTWSDATQRLKHVIWLDGVSAWPAFGLSALFLGTVPIPLSTIPGMTPRLARLAFGGAFATAGFAIRSGDDYNGASIATWWSLSHVVLASLTKRYRKEMAKRLAKPLPSTSPLAGIMTLATIGTGVAYGITI